MRIWERLPARVRLVEVGPRDGLQNEPVAVPVAAKLRFIELLAEAGLSDIEATAFVSPRVVPQLADAEELFALLRQRSAGPVYWALVPNMKGLERALAAGARAIAVFTGATDAFTRHNIRMTVLESLVAFRPVVKRALDEGLRVRGYISVCFGCPYEGSVEPRKASAVPTQIPAVVGPVLAEAGAVRVAVHFHDTRGTALANALAALLLGVTTFDTSAGGLGGCPFAPGAAGNLATEDLLYMLHGMGIQTGVSLEKVAAASRFILGVLGRPPAGRYLQACSQIAAPAGAITTNRDERR
jgi:isopropylmalate/homocitrate/citramalate synthase